jgi:hypothetical protein
MVERDTPNTRSFSIRVRQARSLTCYLCNTSRRLYGTMSTRRCRTLQYRAMDEIIPNYRQWTSHAISKLIN